jgi:hypothetical protein
MFGELAYEVCDLHTLVVVSGTVGVGTGKFMAEREATVFLCIKPFVLYCPPVSAGVCQVFYVLFIYRLAA